MNNDDQLIFRYDNAPHHQEFATFPRHKHLPTGLLETAMSSFADVFIKVESYVLGIV